MAPHNRSCRRISESTHKKACRRERKVAQLKLQVAELQQQIRRINRSSSNTDDNNSTSESSEPSESSSICEDEEWLPVADTDTDEECISEIVSSDESMDELDVVNFDPINNNDSYDGEEVLIGHYIECRAKGTFDMYSIDLSILHENLRTIRTAHLIAKSWKYCTDFIMKGDNFLDDTNLTKIISREDNNNMIEEADWLNIVAAPPQIGKTKITVAISYFSMLALGLVGMNLVRNAGGDEHFESMRMTYKNLTKTVLANFVNNQIELSREEQNLFEIKVYGRDNLRRLQQSAESCVQLTNLRQYFVLLDRQNTTTLRMAMDCIFGVKSINNETGGKHRFVYTADEDDESCSSPSRNSTKFETVSYQQSQQILESDAADVDVGLEQVLTFFRKTLRSQAAVQVCISATTFPITNLDSTKYKHHINNITMTKPANYVGFYHSDEEQVEDRLKIKIVKLPGQQLATKFYKTAPKIENTQNPQLGYSKAYVCDKSGIDQTMKHANETYNELDRNLKYDHISVLISTSCTTEKLNMLYLVRDVVFTYGAAMPIIAFAFNADDVVFTVNTKNCYFARWQHIIADLVQTQIWEDGNDRTKIRIVPEQSDDPSLASYTLTLQSYIGETKLKKNLRRTYTVLQHLFKSLMIRPFIVCVAGKLANRCLTFKTHAHEMPLTHMYYSNPKSTHGNAIQTSGRLAGRDNFLRPRYIMVYQETYDNLSRAFEIDQALMRHFKTKNILTTQNILQDIDQQNVVLHKAIVDGWFIHTPKYTRAHQSCAQISLKPNVVPLPVDKPQYAKSNKEILYKAMNNEEFASGKTAEEIVDYLDNHNLLCVLECNQLIAPSSKKFVVPHGEVKKHKVSATLRSNPTTFKILGNADTDNDPLWALKKPTHTESAAHKSKKPVAKPINTNNKHNEATQLNAIYHLIFVNRKGLTTNQMVEILKEKNLFQFYTKGQNVPETHSNKHFKTWVTDVGQIKNQMQSLLSRHSAPDCHRLGKPHHFKRRSVQGSSTIWKLASQNQL